MRIDCEVHQSCFDVNVDRFNQKLKWQEKSMQTQCLHATGAVQRWYWLVLCAQIKIKSFRERWNEKLILIRQHKNIFVLQSRFISQNSYLFVDWIFLRQKTCRFFSLDFNITWCWRETWELLQSYWVVQKSTQVPTCSSIHPLLLPSYP